MRPFVWLAGLALALAGCAHSPGPIPPGPLPPGCALTLRATVPLRDERNFMLAPVALEGEPATLVVDTGAEATTIMPAAVQRLGLKPDGLRPTTLLGVAGRVRSQDVRLHRLSLADLTLRLDNGVGVGDLPAFPGVAPPVSGLLGADVLSRFEVELDLPGRRMSLYSAQRCAGYLPWPGAVALPLDRPRGGLAFVTAQVDGKPVRALLDTGARTTLVTRAAALRLGVSDAALAGDLRHAGVGVGSATIAFRQHRFASIGVPGATMRDSVASVADLRLPGVDMLLGADFLGRRRVWISYATGRLFLR